MFNLMHLSTYDIKLSDGPRLKTLDQVHAEGMFMQCLLPGDVSLCSKGHYHQAHRRMKLSMYFLFVTSSGRPSSLKQSSSFTRNPKPDYNTVKHSEKTNQLAQKLSTRRWTHGQLQLPTFSPSLGCPRRTFLVPPLFQLPWLPCTCRLR